MSPSREHSRLLFNIPAVVPIGNPFNILSVSSRQCFPVPDGIDRRTILFGLPLGEGLAKFMSVFSILSFIRIRHVFSREVLWSGCMHLSHHRLFVNIFSRIESAEVRILELAVKHFSPKNKRNWKKSIPDKKVKRKKRKAKPSGAPGILVCVFLSTCGSLAAKAIRDGSCVVCLLFHRK